MRAPTDKPETRTSRRLFRTFTGPCCAEEYARRMLALYPGCRAFAGTEDIYWRVEAPNRFHVHQTIAESMAGKIGLRPWRTFPVEDMGEVRKGGA